MTTVQQRPYDESVLQRLVDSGMHPVIARVYAARQSASDDGDGLTSVCMQPPMRDLARAAQRLARAIQRREPIAVIGDYDAAI
ncbi:hypothetical protein [Acidithiobacillus ferridurans]|uniref:Single-stranded-DNA-specific exonuclease RecJ n=1 Tax=Acidithiobacillus ferridurans TaxID=1232575 RepID=A0A8X8KAM4_ACIFI|nr:hypothetical protein [Acidithiobacillus ferridurans]MBU2717064.1 hypothetical protein [Acidithiobacillus ferridurans]MBU2723786.1 hypothetical protein [Acidithiobacillus ferridurans]MBU2725101.1 hypothetical protein [Acidithiobacillus ferridurans]